MAPLTTQPYSMNIIHYRFVGLKCIFCLFSLYIVLPSVCFFLIIICLDIRQSSSGASSCQASFIICLFSLFIMLGCFFPLRVCFLPFFEPFAVSFPLFACLFVLVFVYSSIQFRRLPLPLSVCFVCSLFLFVCLFINPVQASPSAMPHSSSW